MPSYDLQELKIAATGHWPVIVARIAGAPSELLEGKHGPCPKHGGKDKFRVFDDFQESGGAVCNDCGKMADGFALLQSLLGCSFPRVLELVGNHLGVEPKETRGRPRNDAPIDPAKHLKFLGQSEGMAAIWGTIHKPGIKPEALWAFGAQYAKYRDRYPVFAIPIRGKDNEPVGWCLYHATGQLLPIFAKGSKEPIEWRKIKITSGSKPGWIGPLPKSTDRVFWKPEGPSCSLTLYSLGLPDGHTIRCNAFGAEENPATTPWMLDHFKHANGVYVCHDSDKSGQAGATEVVNETGTRRPGWAPAIANVANGVRNYVLPWPMVESHGQDLRDLINLRRKEGLTDGEIYQFIFSAARLADIVKPVAIKPKAEHSNVLQASDSDPEYVDDPHRLARINLARYQDEFGRTIRYWKETWYSWRDGAYEEMSNDHFANRLTDSIKKEFDKARARELEAYNRWKNSEAYSPEKDRGEPKSRKVTCSLVNNVMQATKSMVSLRSSQQLHSWDDGHEEGFCVAVQNGILNVSKAISPAVPAPTVDEILLKHTPHWFSTSKLCFPFDPKAQCPTWNRFLDQVFNADNESIHALQKWFGYLLTPDNSLGKILFVIGKKRSGKGTITSVMTELFGRSNIVTPTLGSLSGEFALQPLIGKTVGIIPDARLSERVDEVNITERLLSISGGDPQNVSRKYKDTLSSHDLKVRFTIFSNLLPKFKDPSAAFLSRCIFLRMPNSYLGQEDFTLQDKLRSELSGILNWAIIGRHYLNEEKRIHQPKMAQSIVDEMLNLLSPENMFIESECIVATDKTCDTKHLFKQWEQWCEENDIAAVGNIQSFSRRVKSILPELRTQQYLSSPSVRSRRFVGIQHKEVLF